MSRPMVADVYGAILRDAFDGKPVTEIVERDDGFVMAFDARYLLAPFRSWNDPNERRAMRFVRGRVLDVGCGGGRVCLLLQARGLEVIGIDSSPGAIAVCARRGVLQARVLAADALDGSLGLFDTLVLLGQGLGMLGSVSGHGALSIDSSASPHHVGESWLRRLTRTDSTIQCNRDTSRQTSAGAAWRGSFVSVCVTASSQHHGSIGSKCHQMSSRTCSQAPAGSSGAPSATARATCRSSRRSSRSFPGTNLARDQCTGRERFYRDTRGSLPRAD
jgi:SAM-dependent methyltransferase